MRLSCAGLSKRLARLALDRGGLVALVTLILYVWIASPHVVYGDNAEFSALSTLGGVAHPTGYPLYVLWLRAWSWLPVDSPAHAASIATGILTALEILVLHAACRAWGARPLAATLAVALLAACPIVLRIQSEAEVFAMNGLLCGGVLWLAAAEGPLRGRWRIVVLGLCAGLGMANHMTCVLVAPVGLYGVWRGHREAGGSIVISLGLAVAGLAAGLSPYLYLFVAPDSWVSWRRIDSIAALVRHILREDYGGPGAFSPMARETSAIDNLVALFSSIGRAYLYLPAVIGAGALGYFTVKRDRAEPRLAWGLLAAAILLAGPLLALRFNIPPEGGSLYVIQRFHLLSVALLVIPVAVGLDRLASRYQDRIPERVRTSAALHALVAVIGFLGLSLPSLPYVARMHSAAIEQGIRNQLHSVPPNAIIIGATDVFHFGTGYLQGALGERTDVAAITTIQLGLSSAREKVRQRTGIEIMNIPKGSEDKLSVVIAEQALATGRPVFIDPYQANIAKSLPIYPYGLLFRVLPKGAPMPTLLEIYEINKQLYASYQFGYAFPGNEDQLATDFHVFYARPWRILAEGLAAEHRDEELAFARAMIDELAPK